MKKKMRILFSLLSALLGCFLLLGAFGVFAWKDPDPILTLQAEDGILSGPANVVDWKVGNIGKCGGDSEGMVTFENLQIPADGEYTLRVHYCSGSDDRYFDIDSDSGSYKLDCPSTGSFSTVGTILVDVVLKKGGTLTFGTEWYGPDLDKIEIFEKSALEVPDKSYGEGNYTAFEGGLVLDSKNGLFSLKKGDVTVLENAHAETMIDGVLVESDAFLKHEISENKEAKTITFTHSNHPSFDGTLVQEFLLEEGYIVTRVTVSCSEEVSTNYISALSCYKQGIKLENGVFLQVPYDNDAWVEPKFLSFGEIKKKVTGYEVAAFYNSENGEGLVLGSITHDTWKTGIEFHAKEGEPLLLNIFGGVSDTNTRDKSPHGSVSGKKVSSPKIFLGYFEDYKDGLTAFGKANTKEVPAKESVKDVPFGYNSWGSLQASVSYKDMLVVSDYIKTYLQDSWSKDGAAVYVNIDSFWDRIVANDPGNTMTLDDALKAFVLYCHENGQKAGIYFTPFTAWHGSEQAIKNAKMEGSDYTFYDAVLRSADGSTLYGTLDGAFPLDPTHPGTIARNETQLRYFAELGFEYIKLDFMAHGALEGKHYDASVTTGMQAYNKGMAQILELCADKMYINLSIAPLFPYQYADGRRISCDAFASIDNTKHVLSHLSACFWEKEIYPYPDPDHLVVWGVSEGEARCRVTAGAITGTSFIIGDDLTDIQEGSQKHERMLKMYANEGIISVAKLGKSFTPLNILCDERMDDVYYCVVDGTLYLAVFNFEGGTKSKSIDLSALLESTENMTALELWRNKTVSLEGSVLKYTLEPEDAALFKIGEKAGDDPVIEPSEPDVSESKEPSESVPEPSGPSKEEVSVQTPSQKESEPSSSKGEEKPEPDKDMTGVIVGVAIVLALAVVVVIAVVILKKKK